MFKILEDKFRIPLPAEGSIIENLSAIHLGRLFSVDWASYGMVNKLFYWKSARGKEVDFVIFSDGKPFGIEVKYQNIISDWDEISIKKGIGKGIIVTRDKFEYGEVIKIPIWAFLLLEME